MEINRMKREGLELYKERAGVAFVSQGDYKLEDNLTKIKELGFTLERQGYAADGFSECLIVEGEVVVALFPDGVRVESGEIYKSLQICNQLLRGSGVGAKIFPAYIMGV
tara:strand:+ start:5101 stop:5427 length:327 start_codon:yes stop_codon:yes gene_type:complete